MSATSDIVLAPQPAVKAGVAPRRTVIEFQHVWKIFGPRAAEVVRRLETERLSKADILTRFQCGVGVIDANLAIREGEVFCVMGLSGSGKSTLARLINRLIEPTSGVINIEGGNILAADARRLRQLRAERIGMVFQNFALLPHRTVLENIGLPLEVKNVPRGERRETARRVLDLVGLAGWEHRYAHELSGGMQQRVGIARAMAAGPAILIMDEPFSALDPLIRRQLQDEFLEIKRRAQMTTLFITHDLDEAIRVGDRIAIMKDGMIVQVGTPEEIVMNPADPYVADFVSGISHLHLVTARRIMVPVADYRARHPQADLASAARVRPDDHLSVLLDTVIARDGPIVVAEDAQSPLGVVDHADLLRAVRGGTATAAPKSQTAVAATAGDGIENFDPQHASYYGRQFAKLNRAVRFGFTFNIAAALLGPVWLAYRRLYPMFWIFLLLEAAFVVQLGSGLWSNLGGEELARASRLHGIAAERFVNADKLGRDSTEGAQLVESAGALQNAAAAAEQRGKALNAGRYRLIVSGVAGLLLVKLLAGILGNWAVHRRFARWQAEPRLRAGVSIPAAIGGALIAAVVYGVTTFAFVSDSIPSWLAVFPAGHQLRVGLATAIDHGLDFVTASGRKFFVGITAAINFMLGVIEMFFARTPWPITMLVIASIAWLRGRFGALALAGVAFAFIAAMGLWSKAMETVSLLGTAALVSIAIGIPLGILCAKSRTAYRLVQPTLSLMQTMPAFVYLIPAIAFFGIGKPPGILATIIFAVPPMVRLTVLGIEGVPETVREAAVAFGASRSFLLFNVELPLALPSIKAGINQTTMMCLSMTVVAALIGAKGLGEDVLTALGQVAAGDGIIAGTAIIFCALVLDRIMQGRDKNSRRRDT